MAYSCRLPLPVNLERELYSHATALLKARANESPMHLIEDTVPHEGAHGHQHSFSEGAVVLHSEDEDGYDGGSEVDSGGLIPALCLAACLPRGGPSVPRGPPPAAFVTALADAILHWAHQRKPPLGSDFPLSSWAGHPSHAPQGQSVSPSPSFRPLSALMGAVAHFGMHRGRPELPRILFRISIMRLRRGLEEDGALNGIVLREMSFMAKFLSSACKVRCPHDPEFTQNWLPVPGSVQVIVRIVLQKYVDYCACYLGIRVCFSSLI